MDGQVDGGQVDGGQPTVEEGVEDFSLDYTGTEGEEFKNEVAPEEAPQDSQTNNLDQNSTQVAEQPQEPPLTDVEALQQRVNELMGVISQYEQQKLLTPQPANLQSQQEKSQAQTQPAQPAMPPPGEVSNLDFLGEGVDHLDILGDKAQFNALLNKVATVSFNAAVNAAQEQIMLKIPDLVRSSAQQQMSINNITTEFYAQNQDLANFRPAVSMAAMQLYNENPKLSLPELLKGAAERTREMLRLTRAPSGGRGRVPAQPAGGSVRSGARPNQGADPELSDQQRQIMELLS